jgi:hypothetical protein
MSFRSPHWGWATATQPPPTVHAATYTDTTNIFGRLLRMWGRAPNQMIRVWKASPDHKFSFFSKENNGNGNGNGRPSPGGLTWASNGSQQRSTSLASLGFLGTCSPRLGAREQRSISAGDRIRSLAGTNQQELVRRPPANLLPLAWPMLRGGWDNKHLDDLPPGPHNME